jgi:hypothetical protein
MEQLITRIKKTPVDRIIQVNKKIGSNCQTLNYTKTISHSKTSKTEGDDYENWFNENVF